MEESAEKIMTIIWIGLVPPVLTLIIFTYILLSLESAKIGHNLMCSALIGRLGHCTIVVIMWSIFTLEHWNWPKEMCYILTWAWITFWIGDILNIFFFLVYYNFRYGAKISGKRVSGFLITFFTWMFSLLIGGLPVFMETSFHNYNAAEETCVLDFVKSERHVRIAAVLVHVLGPLFCFVLCVTINVEFKSITAKHRLYCRINYLNIDKNQLVQPRVDDQVSDKSTTESGSNNSSVRTLYDNNKMSKTTDSLARKEVRKCGVVERGNGEKECEYMSNVRDTRNMLNAVTMCTILLNSVPQLVLYIIEIASADLSVYTHFTLVSVGMLHSLALPIGTCLATYRYAYLARKLIGRFFCGKEKARKTSRDHQRNNLSTSTETTISKSPSNIVTVSNIVESSNSPAEEILGDRAVDLDQVTVHEITPSDQERLALTPPPMPSSRHPSFNQGKNTSPENPKVELNGHFVKPDQTEDNTADFHAAESQTQVQVNIEEPVINTVTSENSQTAENNKTGQDTLDMSIKSIDIGAIQEANKPHNVLDLPVLARSNSAVIVPHTDDMQEAHLSIRRTTSSVQSHDNQNEGPFVDWQPGPGIGTLFIRKIQSGDKTYLSCDYHHNAISDGIQLNGEESEGESYYSEEDSSYFDSDSAGWSHMYTDTDMEETLERNKEKRNSVKRTAAKRIPSNDSSLVDEKKKRARARHKKKVKKKKSKTKGKNVEKGLGTALQTLMVMPGTNLAHRPKETNLSKDNTKNLNVNISEDVKTTAASQISPGVGPDGNPIEVPPPPTFVPPPLPSENNHDHTKTDEQNQPPTEETTDLHDAQSPDGHLENTADPVKFPATVLPFQNTYVTTSQSTSIHEQQSFIREAPTGQTVELKPDHNPYLDLEPKEEIHVNKSNEPLETSPSAGDTTQKYHPSIYSIVKERTKAQKAWQKAFQALAVTDFLKKANQGVADNGHNGNEDSNGLRSRNTVNRTSAHNYVNTGSSGMFVDIKQNTTIPSNDEDDEWNDL